MKKFTEWLKDTDKNTFGWLAEALSFTPQGTSRFTPKGSPSSSASSGLDQFLNPPYNVDRYLIDALKMAMQGKGDMHKVLEEITSRRGFQTASIIKKFIEGGGKPAQGMQNMYANDWGAGLGK